MEQKKLLIILSVICSLVFLWSLINPSGYGIWFLEAFPVLVGVPILFFTYKKFKFTNLTYIVIAIHVIILLVGAHYTYAENPLFEWIKNYFDLERNHYDRLGHFFQGFAPILIAREFLLRKTPLKQSKMLIFLLISIIFTITATYELIEWWTSEIVAPELGPAFVSSQGDVWDAQKDMFLAFLGGIIALLTLSKEQNRQLKLITKK
ncbi:DUF2238 domain-containing protein [Candidatus Woesearchaeota archaeon]|nr:DUF2238 domain-containing protein [Candidatus Woesearchaeota archaeon]